MIFVPKVGETEDCPRLICVPIFEENGEGCAPKGEGAAPKGEGAG
jgi:hypothetical protein